MTTERRTYRFTLYAPDEGTVFDLDLTPEEATTAGRISTASQQAATKHWWPCMYVGLAEIEPGDYVRAPHIRGEAVVHGIVDGIAYLGPDWSRNEVEPTPVTELTLEAKGDDNLIEDTP